MPTLHCPDPRCRHEYRVPASSFGTTGRCPACGQPHTLRPSASVTAQVRDEADRIEVAAAGARSDVVPLHLALVSIRSLWNVGSIFRTADGLGVAGIHLLGFTATPENPRLARTALGAERSVPWTHHPDVAAGLDELGREMQMMALECSDAARVPEVVPLHPPVCLVLGNEVVGLPDEVMARCQEVVALPMHGAKRSLNVAVAAGIAGHVLARRMRLEGTAGAARCPSP